MGQLANEVRAALEAAIEAAAGKLEAQALEQRLEAEAVDVTIPGKSREAGPQAPHVHWPWTRSRTSSSAWASPCWTARRWSWPSTTSTSSTPRRATPPGTGRDTFYFDEDSRVMLRSQTSPMQVRAMETMELPIRIIAPGRVYRKDEVDATHSPMFHQVEGMVIDKGVTMADLKGTLNTVVEQLYGKGTKTRFRPHHFPFTEPSCEMDVQCHKCGGVGCPTCKGEGWIELLGAGMVHPKVLQMARHRPGGLLRLGLRHGPGAHRHAPLQDRRPAAHL